MSLGEIEIAFLASRSSTKSVHGAFPIRRDACHCGERRQYFKQIINKSLQELRHRRSIGKIDSIAIVCLAIS
jgi:hypothetical protein